MKKFLAILVMVLGFTFTAQAQKAKKVALEQTKGEFTQKSLTLSEGTYVFEIENAGVGHDVGFVLAPKGKTSEKHHIKNAYVTSLVKNNKKSKSKKVTLTKGEYVYFCPLNPTPQYTLIVE
ncbi:cupredoxin domain-containing protein [Aureivirga marina]|uniref:cupredoxin domain-containing protein n=1 Tax=Aureivirga marina TaxID=1182451 RepID=UPI0018CB32EC|nr:cupredoxin domain-containing protein [Aureivirga marina]